MRARIDRAFSQSATRAAESSTRRVSKFSRTFFTRSRKKWGRRFGARRFRPNIKERRDYSCAVYDADGQVLAMGDHMPVHLGSMPASVAQRARAALAL